MSPMALTAIGMFCMCVECDSTEFMVEGFGANDCVVRALRAVRQ